MSKKLLFDLVNTSTSGPLIVPGIFHNAIATAETLNNVNRILNAKNTVKIGSHNLGNIFQEAGCDPTNSGEGTLSDKDVTVCSLDIYMKFCQATLEQSFLSTSLKPGSNIADFLPADFYNYLGEVIGAKAAATIETMFWQGNPEDVEAVYPNTLCEGLLVQFDADSAVVDVTGTTITSSNVYAELAKVLSALPITISPTDPDLVMYVSPSTANAYIIAQSNSTGGIFVVGQKELNYNGIKMVISTGMPANKIVLTKKSNLFFITDLVSDYEDIAFIPQFNNNGKHQVITSGNLKVAFSYVNPTEIIYYH